MARGGKRPGAGRKPGSKNKLTRDIERKLGAEKPPAWAAAAVKCTLAELAASYRSLAMATLVCVCESDTATGSARVQAASALLDRSDGKPVQALEHSGKDGQPIETRDVSEVSELEIARRIAFVLSRAAPPKKKG